MRARTAGVRCGLVISLIAVACGPAAAQDMAEIIDWGITAGRRAASASQQRGETGLTPARGKTDIRYLERTDVIEARLCRSFGMTVKLRGSLLPLPSQVVVTVTHPLFTRPDGATSTEDRFKSAVLDGRSWVGFTFDHPWEMQPGAWRIGVAAGGREIAAKAFTVVAPASGAPRSDCQSDPAS